MVVQPVARRVLPRRRGRFAPSIRRDHPGTPPATERGAPREPQRPRAQIVPRPGPDPDRLACALELPAWPVASASVTMEASDWDDLRRLEAHVSRPRPGPEQEDRRQLLRVLEALLLWTGARELGRLQLALIAATWLWFVPLWRPVWRGLGSVQDDLGAARALVATLLRRINSQAYLSIRLPFAPFVDVWERLGELEIRLLRERLTTIDQQLELLAFNID